jgi:hypothetical protein
LSQLSLLTTKAIKLVTKANESSEIDHFGRDDDSPGLGARLMSVSGQAPKQASLKTLLAGLEVAGRPSIKVTELQSSASSLQKPARNNR